MKNFGLTERDFLIIGQILSKYKSVKEVRIFGSRSKGVNHTGSDIDLAIMDHVPGLDVLLHLKSDFDDSDLPYTVDIVCYSKLNHQELKDHINRVGKVVYRA